MNRILPLALLLLTFSIALMGQNQKVTDKVRCYTDEHTADMRQQYPQMQTQEEFEQWMSQKLEELRERRASGEYRQALYRIPYIVHVVHAGESVGTGDNLSEAQVNAQIQQINDDFNRTNSDASNTPDDFIPVAASLDIEFVPAVVDPDGNILDEPGINRVNGQADFGTTSWGTGAIDDMLKPNTYWDPTLVFNIWSVNMGGGLLGYAQFPEAPTLPGVGTGNGPADTDGVVCLSGTLGSIDMPGPEAPFDIGRTLTHELGHWAGLLHIWGGSGCASDDFCDDTPPASGPNFTGSPCSFPGPNSCSGDAFADMFQNYMDYSDDACFNLFTQDQVDRMIIVLENSPRRNELLTSTIWELPSSDTIIAGFDQDNNGGCAPVEVTFTDDSFEGDEADPITSWEWNFDVDGLGGATPSTFIGQSPPTVTFTTPGSYTVSLSIDNGTYSGTATGSVNVDATLALDLIMGFEGGIPGNWTNDLWQESSSVGFNSNASIFQDNFFNSSEIPAFISTPSLDFDVEATFIELTFDYAHAYYGGGFGEEEGLAVNVSTDCGETWEEVYIRLNSDADPFWTVESTSSGWEPEDDEWRSETIDLTSYMGEASVRVQFHGISDYGNDTYIDNINIKAVTVAPDNIEAGFTSSAEIACEGQSVVFTDASVLGVEITDPTYEWNFDVNGTGSADPATYIGETPPAVVFTGSGIYTVELTVSQDANSDSYSMDIEIGGALDLPLAEDFEGGTFPPTDWTVGEGIGPFPVGFASDNSLFIDNYNNQDLRADVTLPAYDFSAVGRAELTFDISHTFFTGTFGNLYDTLAIAYSLDCGGTWTELWRKDDGDPLNPLYTADGTNSGYVPGSDDEWRAESVDVTFLQGNENVQLRFENRGGYGNSLFLDNINIEAELVAPDEVFAYFGADAAGGCVGSAVTFEDLSTAGANTAITSWEWNFDTDGSGTATPSTYTGQDPPAVTFDEPGDYTVTLTVSDGSTSDDYTAQISIEVPVDLTYNENFAASDFPPDGWTAILWEQAVESSDELLGSLWANNYFIVDLKANAFTPSFDMSWYDQIAMTFDVSHARFSGSENEGLVINYSADCGASWTEAWSKYDFDPDPLYTVDDFETGAFFPTNDGQWREETVDLSTLNDFSSVKLELFNDGFYGNNTFVDDIQIEGWILAPTDLTAAVQGTNNIELNWMDNSEKEAGYEVQRWNDATGMFETIAMLDAGSETYTDAGLSGEQIFTYQVCAYNEMARACSEQASDTTEAILIVSGLIAEVSDQSGTSVELTWDDFSTTEDGFLIKRSEDGGPFEVINILTPNQNYYLDEFLDETVTYDYQVCAFNELDTVESNIDDATTLINAPSNLTTTAEDNNIRIAWTDNSDAEEGFQVKRSLTSGGPYATVATVPANVTSYTDFGLQELTEYCYVVCAFNAIDVACTADESCATTDIASAIFEELNSAITLYPNPANEFVDIELTSIKGDVKVNVFNNIGEIVMNESLSGGAVERLEVDDLAAGVYMIKLETKDGFTTKKLVIQ